MTTKSYGPVGTPMVIVSECTGHTCHSQHHVLWYLFHQPMTTVFKKQQHMNSISKKKHVYQGQGEGGGGKFNLPVKVGGTLVESVHVASAVINRIAPQGSHSLLSEVAQHHCFTPLRQHLRILPQQNSQKIIPGTKN